MKTLTILILSLLFVGCGPIPPKKGTSECETQCDTAAQVCKKYGDMSNNETPEEIERYNLGCRQATAQCVVACHNRQKTNSVIK